MRLQLAVLAYNLGNVWRRLGCRRYCSWPGQACGYKVGHSEINRQRETATVALGLRFDSKAFNDTVVLGGNVPLDLLAKNVDEYIQNTNKR